MQRWPIKRSSGIRRSATTTTTTIHGYHRPRQPQRRWYSLGGGTGGGGDGDTMVENPAQIYAQMPTTNLTLKELLRWGEKPVTEEKLIRSAQVNAFQQLPFIVGMNPHIRQVYQLYQESFDKLRTFPEVKTLEQERDYTESLSALVEGHADVVPTLAKGIQECQRYMSKPEITEFLNRTIQARIGIRVIAEHHLALHNHRDLPNCTGILHHLCSPKTVLQRAAPFAQELCELNFGSYPDFQINGHVETTFPYIDVHLEYMVFELLKNSFRATVEYSRKLGRKEHPPVEITIGNSIEDVTIRIRDHGGGIPEERTDYVWDYSYSTVDEEEASIEEQTDTIFATTAKLGMVSGSGLGYGLPMTRIYAKWAGGSLDLVSLPEHGCDVFLRIPDIGNVDEIKV